MTPDHDAIREALAAVLSERWAMPEARVLREVQALTPTVAALMDAYAAERVRDVAREIELAESRANFDGGWHDGMVTAARIVRDRAGAS
jgi:hypothetical protein